MLNNSYHHCIVGHNYISLLYGLVSLKNDNSTLMVKTDELSLANTWCRHIGHIERTILKNLGDKYNIETLSNIDNYLVEQNTILNLDNTLIEFCSSPYANIKEIARKIPDCFTNIYTDNLININSSIFDQDFILFIEKIAEKSFDFFDQKNMDIIFDTSSNLEIQEIYSKFLIYLEQNNIHTKQLHYILQVMFQSVFSSAKSQLETKYLLTSLISPRYKVDFKELEDDLLIEYRDAGGDLKETSISDWGVKDKNLEYILLNSIDGIIQVDQLFYFNEAQNSFPFNNKSKGIPFKSIAVTCPIDHELIEYFKNKRIVFSLTSRMGSDFPFWEISFDDLGVMNAKFTYADYQGTKESFYFHKALEDLYLSLLTILPGVAKADFISRAKLILGEDLWFEYSPEQKKLLHPESPYKLDSFFDNTSLLKVDRIKNCSSNRTKSLGFYTYLLDVFSPSSLH